MGMKMHRMRSTTLAVDGIINKILLCDDAMSSGCVATTFEWDGMVPNRFCKPDKILRCIKLF